MHVKRIIEETGPVKEFLNNLIMIAQWEIECSSLFNPWPWWSISRNLSLTDHTLPTCPESVWQKAV